MLRNPNELLKVTTLAEPSTKINLDSRIKCFGLGLYDFVYEDGTFAQWLIENPYSKDESSNPIVHMMKRLQIPNPNPKNDIHGRAILLNPGSKIKMPQSCDLPDQETIKMDPQEMKVESGFVEKAALHVVEVRGVTKDIVADLNLEKEAMTSLFNLSNQKDIKETEKASNKSHSHNDEITNPIVMFTR